MTPSDIGPPFNSRQQAVIDAAAWMVGDGDEELGGPFHEGAYRSLVEAVRAMQAPPFCACGAVNLEAVADRVWVDDNFIVHRLDTCSDADGCPNDA